MDAFCIHTNKNHDQFRQLTKMVCSGLYKSTKIPNINQTKIMIIFTRRRK
nr:MAG TPA: hypothetical protein [Caudoviricetes sp.]